jgi:uncharacterized membrane protein YphA (DoxX/SURF4 family)
MTGHARVRLDQAVLLAARCLLGCAFLLAAANKFLNPEATVAFLQAVRGIDALPRPVHYSLGALAGVWEAVLGVMLFAGSGRMWGIAATCTCLIYSAILVILGQDGCVCIPVVDEYLGSGLASQLVRNLLLGLLGVGVWVLAGRARSRLYTAKGVRSVDN